MGVKREVDLAWQQARHHNSVAGAVQSGCADIRVRDIRVRAPLAGGAYPRLATQ